MAEVLPDVVALNYSKLHARCEFTRSLHAGCTSSHWREMSSIRDFIHVLAYFHMSLSASFSVS